jgi:hypothetical protein
LPNLSLSTNTPSQSKITNSVCTYTLYASLIYKFGIVIEAIATLPHKEALV